MLILLAMLSCDNSCIHLCQHYEAFLDRCGYGWSTWFHDEGWTSIEDCYDTYWEADEGRQGECEAEIPEWTERGCEDVVAYE